MTGSLTVSLDGITDLPRGHVATIKTYLAMDRPAIAPTAPEPGPARLARLTGADHARYRALFRTLGTRWLWWSRLLLTEVALQAILDDPAVEAFALVDHGRDIGLLELDFHGTPVADLAFLGLIEGQTGKGTGRWLMDEAKARVWSRPGVTRLTVNTCTLDSPQALGFYRAHGFSAEKQAVEMVPDPRLTGLLPAGAAPHIPLLP